MALLAGGARWGASILKQQELYREFRALGRGMSNGFALSTSSSCCQSASVGRWSRLNKRSPFGPAPLQEQLNPSEARRRAARIAAKELGLEPCGDREIRACRQ
jgi:hypothetical protein